MKPFYKLGSAIGLATVVIVALAPAAIANPESLNFDDLVAGQGITDDMRALLRGKGVELSSQDKFNNPLNIFDTSCQAHSCANDPDLKTGGSFGGNNVPGRGNVLIIQEKNNKDKRDVTNPDDSEAGGNLIFDFIATESYSGLVDFNYIEMLDLDGQENVRFDFWYEGDDELDNNAFTRFTHNGNGDSSLFGVEWIVPKGNNSISRYTFDHGDKKVAKVGVELIKASGAVSEVNYTPVPPMPETPTPTEVPEPSTALGLLAFGAAIKAARGRKTK